MRDVSGDPAELAGLRDIVVALAGLRDQLAEAPEGFVERAVANARAARWQLLARRVASDDRVQHAALSVGGAAVGAAAVGLIWWRRGRRSARQGPALAIAEG